MSLIKHGKCENCGKDFYFSIGHPDWFDGGFNFASWRLPNSTEEKPKEPPQEEMEKKDARDKKMRDWWFGSGNLCPRCHPPVPTEDNGINISVVG
jgi:hypothetical protein